MSTPTPVKLSRPCIGAKVLRVLLVLPVLPLALSAAPLRMATEAYVTNATSALDASLSSRLSLASLAATNYTDAATAALSAAKQDKLPYPTNAIPQGAVSGLSTALAGKLDKTGGTMTGSVQFNDGWTAMGDMSDTISVGQDAGDGYVRIGETKYRRTGILAHNAYLFFPADSGTIALTSDIPDVSAIGDDATNYTDSAIGAAIAPANPTFSNAVLSVGLGVDTNTVAAINALVEAGEELPIGGVTSVGALLLALAAAIAALKKRLPYALVVKEIENGAVTLDDRASNTVEISATLSPNTLTINFPTATSGKVRDFAMRLNIAAGVTAPEIAWPQGVTLENDDGEVPEIADGGTGGSSTILYFSETENNGTTAKFLVKGETLTAITQA